MNKLISTVLGIGVKDIVASIGVLVDKTTTTDDERLEQKAKISAIVTTKLQEVVETQSTIIDQEIKGVWLQKNWRPIIMLTFGVILVSKWFGFAETNIPLELEMQLFEIIKLGLGGYVFGRSGEKMLDTITKNIDLSFIKKKNRNTD